MMVWHGWTGLKFKVIRMNKILTDSFFNANKGSIYKTVLDEVERKLLEETLIRVHGNQTKAAEALGLNRGTLRSKIEYFKLGRLKENDKEPSNAK